MTVRRFVSKGRTQMTKCAVILVFLMFAATACESANDDLNVTTVEPQVTAMSSPTSTPDPTATPAPAPTSTPTPEPTATATPTPLPTPTSRSEVALDIENIGSIAYTANLDLSDLVSESERTVTAYLTGWMTVGGDSQVFVQVDMSRPVEKSFELLLSNSFDVHLRDIEEDRWFFIPENSDAGPLEDIFTAVFVVLAYSDPSVLEDVQPVEGGYAWTVEGAWGTTTAVYDEGYLLTGFSLTDPDGHELISVDFYGHGEEYSFSTPKRGELLPEGYWGSP